MSYAFARSWPPLIQSVKKTTLHLCSHTGASLLVPLVWGCAGVQQHSGAADPPGRGAGSHCTIVVQPGTRDGQNSPASTVVNRGFPPDISRLWIRLYLNAFGTTSVIQLGGFTCMQSVALQDQSCL